jgi:asparagine synthase (glutamine-hydrolysing)
VIRPFAGVLDPNHGDARAVAMRALPQTLPGHATAIAEAGALLVAGSDLIEVEGVLCLVDGAVYNHRQLARQLGIGSEERQEVVLAHGYRRWGGDLAPRLRGEFSLLAWDRHRQRGILVPDQLGVRRLVVRIDGRRLWFASEVRHLLPLLASRPGPNPTAVSHWLTGRPAPRGATLYRGIDCPGPGQMVELGFGGGNIRRYWRPRYREPLAVSRGELMERIRSALGEAVARRTTADAPIGILMSGGLDSTSVAALAHRISSDGARAFSATFPDYPHIDESAWIDALESQLGLPGVSLAAGPQGILASGLEHLAEWGLPLHAWSEPWTQPLLRRAAEMGVTAMLSGEGGDELFGSRMLLTADLMRRGRPIAAARFARGLPEAGGRAPRRVLAQVLWRFGVQGMPAARLEAIWHATRRGSDTPWWASREMARLLRKVPEPTWRNTEGPRWWAHLSHALTEGVHGYGVLDHLRRRTEQAGLEARHPLLDLDLLELMLQVPPMLCSEGRLTRPLLREAMAGISPDVVRMRPDKSVFDEPVTDALTGPELPALREILGNATEIRAYARREAIAELLDNPPPHQRGDAGAWGEHVLRLTAIELWLRYQGDHELPRKLLESSLVAAPRAYQIETRFLTA